MNQEISKEKMMDYKVIKSINDFIDLKDIWNSLLAQNASPFMTFEWNLEWLYQYETFYDEILVFVFNFDDNPAVIFPFYVKNDKRTKIARLIGDIVCDYQEIITQDLDSARSCISTLLCLLSKERYHLYFLQVSNKTLIYKLFLDSKISSNYCAYYQSLFPAPYIELPDNWEKFQKSLKKNLKSSIKRLENKNSREFPNLEDKIYTGTEIDQLLLEKIANLHVKNQFRKKGESVFSDEKFQKLVLNVSNTMNVGMCIATLESENNIMAFVLGFERHKTFYYYIPAYEEDFSNFSPGKILVYRLVKRMIEKQFTTFDFLNGSESYKFLWTDKEIEILRLTLYPRTFFNIIRTNSLFLNKFARKNAKKILSKLNIYSKLLLNKR